MKSTSISRSLSRTGTVRLAASLIGVIAGVAVVGWAVLGSGGGAQAGTSAPFKGRGALTMTVGASPKCAQGQIFVQASGSGNATELGEFTVVQSHCSFLPGAITQGEITYTAANGDTLSGTYEGESTPASPGVLALTIEGTLTGGSGRFAGASGSVDVTGTAELSNMTATYDFEGTITTVGSGK